MPREPDHPGEEAPGHLEGLAKAMRGAVGVVTTFERDACRQRSVDYRAHARALAEVAAEVERRSHGVSLKSLDCGRDCIWINGVPYVRVLCDIVAEYETLRRTGPGGASAVPRRGCAERREGEHGDAGLGGDRRRVAA